MLDSTIDEEVVTNKITTIIIAEMIHGRISATGTMKEELITIEAVAKDSDGMTIGTEEEKTMVERDKDVMWTILTTMKRIRSE